VSGSIVSVRVIAVNEFLAWIAANKDALSLIGGAIAAVAAGVWTVLKFRRGGSDGGDRAESGGVVVKGSKTRDIKTSVSSDERDAD